MRTVLVLGILASCVPPSVVRAPVERAPQPAFGCTGAPALAPLADAAPGHVEARKRKVDAGGPHLELRAERASIAQLAVAVGVAVGRETHVEPGDEDVRLTFYAPDVTLDQLHALLARESGFWVIPQDGTLVFRPPGGGTRWHPDAEPVSTKAIAVVPGTTGEQIATLFCRIASPDGWAQVLGDRVLVTDRAWALTVLDLYLRSFATQSATATR